MIFLINSVSADEHPTPADIAATGGGAPDPAATGDDDDDDDIPDLPTAQKNLDSASDDLDEAIETWENSDQDEEDEAALDEAFYDYDDAIDDFIAAEDQAEADRIAAMVDATKWSYNSPGSWIKGYEDYDALAGWLLGSKDEETQARQDELRDQFCEGMGVVGAALMEDCAIATMCESELYDFEDIDGVVVGLTSSGELISVMHAEGWRTPGMVFINETSGEVFTDVSRYLYKATWNVVMQSFSGGTALVKVTNPVNRYNVYFKENSVVKYEYYEDWYTLNASETHGLTNSNPFLTYSNNYYDELCLVLETAIDVSLGIGLGTKSYKEICNDLVEHTGDPTQLYLLGTPPGTSPPGVSGGF